MKKLRGYIFSRAFMGERVPQSIQNLVIREFCKRNNYLYLLSAAEYAMNDCSLVLKSIVNNTKGINGIISYSLFQLPQEQEIRTSLLNKMINKKIFFVSALEQIFIKNQKDIEDINILWNIKETLKYCPRDFK